MNKNERETWSFLVFDFSHFCFNLFSLGLASSFLCLKSSNLFIFRFYFQIFTVDSDFWNPLNIRGIITHGGKFTLQFRGLKKQIQNQKCGEKGFVFMQKCVMTQTSSVSRITTFFHVINEQVQSKRSGRPMQSHFQTLPF